MAYVRSSDSVAEFQRTGRDQQIRQSDPQPARLHLAVDASGPESERMVTTETAIS
jgi:hypothetical protein